MNRSLLVMWFAVLTLLLTFAAYYLPISEESKSILFPIVVAFIPTLVATILAGLVERGGALKELYSRLRIGVARWLLLSILVGAGMQLAIALLAVILGYTTSLRLTTSPQLIALSFLTPLFALGEEIGWRGYTLPKLLATQSPLSASLVIGVPWALVHLSLFLPGMMFVGRPMLAQVAPVALFSILHTWVFIKSGGSLWAPSLLHGVFNFLGAVLNSELGVVHATYLGAFVLVASAVIVVAVRPSFWLRKHVGLS